MLCYTQQDILVSQTQLRISNAPDILELFFCVGRRILIGVILDGKQSDSARSLVACIIAQTSNEPSLLVYDTPSSMLYRLHQQGRRANELAVSHTSATTSRTWTCQIIVFCFNGCHSMDSCRVDSSSSRYNPRAADEGVHCR